MRSNVPCREGVRARMEEGALADSGHPELEEPSQQRWKPAFEELSLCRHSKEAEGQGQAASPQVSFLTQ